MNLSATGGNSIFIVGETVSDFFSDFLPALLTGFLNLPASNCMKGLENVLFGFGLVVSALHFYPYMSLA